MKRNGILLKTLPYLSLILAVKLLIIISPTLLKKAGCEWNLHLSELIEISDVGIVFTGAFFVMGLMLAATMSDFKESEKIPGEVASNLEAIEDAMLLAIKTYKPTEGKQGLDANYLKETLIKTSQFIINWFYSNEKDSKAIFPMIRSLNNATYHVALSGGDKEAIKAMQDNINQLRKQLTRAYTIARTNFIKPAYFLLKSILFTVITLLFICKFKTIYGSIMVTGFLSFIFIYLYFLISGLDNPFEIGKDETEVDLLPLDRFKDRLADSFNEN